jgi:hypothetical protein
MEGNIMKYAFVRYLENHREEFGVGTCANLVSGVAAESPEAFIKWHGAGVPAKILCWFEVPESWENSVSSGNMNEAFEAILALDALSETPVVSDLLATIFDEGYRLAQKKERDLATALRALLES